MPGHLWIGLQKWMQQGVFTTHSELPKLVSSSSSFVASPVPDKARTVLLQRHSHTPANGSMRCRRWMQVPLPNPSLVTTCPCVLTMKTAPRQSSSTRLQASCLRFQLWAILRRHSTMPIGLLGCVRYLACQFQLWWNMLVSDALVAGST